MDGSINSNLSISSFQTLKGQIQIKWWKHYWLHLYWFQTLKGQIQIWIRWWVYYE